MHNNLAWDDLQYVLAVGRSGSLSGAARALRVNHSTVFRRVGLIEERLAARLFDRQRDGYIPTVAGEAVVALAERVEEQVIALERRLSGEDLRPSGTVRITTTDTLISTVTPLCGAFRRSYPEICLELVTGNQFLNLSRRDADVAVRPTAAPPDNLHGRRIGRIAFCVYASPQYLAAAGGPDLDRAHHWIGLDDTLSHLRVHDWISEHAPDTSIYFRASSFLAMLDAAAAGMGLAVLPCYLADPVKQITRVGLPLEDVATDLWLLVHEDLRRTARVRAVADFLFTELCALRPRIEGKSA